MQLVILCALTSWTVDAFNVAPNVLKRKISPRTDASHTIAEHYSRRDVGSLFTAAAMLGVSTFSAPAPANAKESAASMLDELSRARTALDPLPTLLDNQEWDAVRSVLKSPPVAYLWQQAFESKNTLRKLAVELDTPEIFEIMEEVSLTLQDADQIIYANVFIYFQPGSGKLEIKAPKKKLKYTMDKLDEALTLAGSAI